MYHDIEGASAQTKLTPAELKTVNRKNVYEYIYQQKCTSKQDIAKALNLSLPTVTQHLSSFIDMGLVEKRGEYESTGGRKAQIIRCSAAARISIGVDLLKEFAKIVAIDLYGSILAEDRLLVPFRNEDSYYQELGSWINRFSAALPYPKEHILGVCIAIQGLISNDGETITFSEILHCTGVKRQKYQQYIDLPCTLVHDTEAAALAEMKNNPELDNAIYIALNRNFGGAIMINRQLLRGKELSGGIIEHMCIAPNGPTCYCGKQGCIETICSADALKNSAQMELAAFFRLVHSNDPRCSKIWRNYLRQLSLCIDNIRMLLDFDFIIGGYLVEYMNEDDFALLTRYVREQCSFSTSFFNFHISRLGEKSALCGAAIMLIEEFLKTI